MHCTTNLKDLLKGKHMLVEELLELLVDVVNADLFKAVVVKDLKAGDVEDTDVGDLLHGGVAQGLVTLVHLKQNLIYEESKVHVEENYSKSSQ